MSDEVTLRRLGEVSVFDEARSKIAEWEEKWPDGARIGLVMETPEDIVSSVVGESASIVTTAGMFFTVAQMENE